MTKRGRNAKTLHRYLLPRVTSRMEAKILGQSGVEKYVSYTSTRFPVSLTCTRRSRVSDGCVGRHHSMDHRLSPRERELDC